MSEFSDLMKAVTQTGSPNDSNLLDASYYSYPSRIRIRKFMLDHYRTKHLIETNGNLKSFDERIYKDEMQAIMTLPLRELVLKYRKVYPFRVSTMKNVLTEEEASEFVPKWKTPFGFKNENKEINE